MRILEKYSSKDFKGFDWLNFDYLPLSESYIMEVYFKESEDLVLQSILSFHLLFRDILSDILINTFRPDSEWGTFCLDTWDIENDIYDYSPTNKQEPTASYLLMLIDNKIEPEYSGFCKCHDWNRFLYVTLHCVMKHVAPYSMMFYLRDEKIAFYFHHTGSIGIYYKELNEEVKNIIRKTQKENMKIKNYNDERVIFLLNNSQ